MSKYLSCSLVLLGWSVACGGSSGPGEDTGAAGASGSTVAGSSGGGSSSAGSTSAGSSSGGTTTNGGTAGTAGTTSSAGTSSGGTTTNGGSAGNGGAGGMTVDPRCPPKKPTGTCSAEQTDALCEYDLLTGCLCFSSSQVATRCTQVDPACTASAPPPDDGAAGGAAKIAPPPKQVCRCSGGSWQCG